MAIDLYLNRLKECSISDLIQEEKDETWRLSNMKVESNLDEALRKISLDIFQIKYGTIKAWKNLNSMSMSNLDKEMTDNILSSIRYSGENILTCVQVLKQLDQLLSHQEENECPEEDFGVKSSEDCQDVKPFKLESNEVNYIDIVLLKK